MARVGERRVRAGIGAVAGAALAAVTLAAPTPAGAGGGDLLYPDRDRYEAGQQVRLVGYTQAQARSTVDERAVADVQRNGPYYAYLRLDPAAVERDTPRDVGPWPYVHPTDRRLGQVTIDEVTPAAGPNYSLRVAAAFWLPRGLAPDVYDVTICNEPCTMTLGWLYSSPVNVGIDPADPIVRLWPLDDPAIRFLGDDALVAARYARRTATASTTGASRPPRSAPATGPRPSPSHRSQTRRRAPRPPHRLRAGQSRVRASRRREPPAPIPPAVSRARSSPG